MKKEVKLIIFFVGLVLTIVILVLICYSFNNYLKGYYTQLANDYINNPQYYLSGGVSQGVINERIRTYTQLSQQSLNGEEPTIFLFGIICWVIIYCIVVGNIDAAINGSKLEKVSNKQTKG